MDSSLVTIDPPLRVMALHALAYCQRLFYLEEVEEIRVADDRVYAGRELHTSLEADEDGEKTQLELTDPELGLFGKVDAIRRRDGSLLPYEHKRGRCRRGDAGAEAWPSDRLQVIAYAALIASTTGEPVAEGRIRYHADNVTVRVPFDDMARADLWGANLSNANLAGANLAGADLRDANLSGARLDGAIVNGVNWTNDTCPDGTKSASNGGTCASNLRAGPRRS